MAISGKDILKYTLTPQLVPRVRALFAEGFSFIAFSMAQLFYAVRLLPVNHPYIYPENIGRFGVLNVLGQAAAHLKPGLRHIDQMALYIIILFGAGLLLAQGIVLLFSLFAHSAHALPSGFSGFFETANPDYDIAFIILDRVFGIPGLFGSCVAQNVPCVLSAADPTPLSGGMFPFPYHTGLHTMLSFYSYGMLVVAALVLSYYVASIAGETAVSGTAFGKRFNRVWAPLRMIIALGLLVPVSYGLNAGQYITLHIAKWGSGLGTNGWTLFMTTLGSGGSLMGDTTTLVAQPNYPDVDDIIKFLAVAKTCAVSYERMYGKRNGDSLEGDTTDMAQPDVRERVHIRPWVLTSSSVAGAGRSTIETLSVTSWHDIATLTDFGPVKVVFGDYNPAFPEKYAAEPGGVAPLCGEVTMQVPSGYTPSSTTDPLDLLQYRYFMVFLRTPWFISGPSSDAFAFDEMATNIANRTLPIGRDPSAPLPTEEDKANKLSTFKNIVGNGVDGYVDEAFNDLKAETAYWTYDAMPLGWGGAGIWYNKISKFNSDFTEAVFNFPAISKYPMLMEFVAEEKSKQDASIPYTRRFEPFLASGQEVTFKNARDKDIMRALNEMNRIWEDFFQVTRPPITGEALTDSVNSIFQKTGLWTFRQNEAQHPMAALVVLGKSLILKSILSFGAGAASRSGALIGKEGIPQQVLKNMSGMLMTVAMIAIISGILLHYVVPFIPFVYFLFAVLAWIKTIFEAMVGMPLWALAHLRYDGEGFPTRQAMMGYFLLVDIFIRPILIIFGLVASSIIFYAMARTLNNVFTIVVSNLAGFDQDAAITIPSAETDSLSFMRSAVDQIFFTIIYAIFVYMIGLSCFKLIDQIPQQVLRWMGAQANTFSMIAREDAGGEFKGMAKQGAYHASDQASGLSGALTGRPVGTDMADRDPN